MGESELKRFSEEEYNKLRKKIELQFNDLSYKISKSSYNWSSEHNWIICVQLTSKLNHYHTPPQEKLDVVTKLIERINNFIKEEKEFNLELVGFTTRENLNFEVSFQPIDVRAAKLLTYAGL